MVPEPRADEKDETLVAEAAPESAPEADPQLLPRRNREMFEALINTFQGLLPPDKGAQLTALAEQLLLGIDDNCAACQFTREQMLLPPPRDPRRNRFLLRLVVGKVSHLFSGPKASMPRALIEGLDCYLKKAFGPMIYEELNAEADQLLYRLNCDDDQEMWRRIRETPDWARFVDTIFLRILFRFESFPQGKKTFMTILDGILQERAHFNITDEHFFAIFEALFASLYDQLGSEEQWLRWDFHFGDGTSKRINAILEQGLARYIKRRNARILGSGRALAPDRRGPSTAKS
ncbi:hypothetical protein GALL_97770 [mine drainage metagenome]|uniref:Uncharacterized protein n=1 Tax=mine drainage metagenome TaxID=410659 RepID=A0A1J5SHN3_9ZZZZ